MRNEGAGMQLALRSRRLIATILLIVVLTASLAILCPDGIHLPVPGGMGTSCLVMTHTSVLGSATGGDSSPLLLSVALVIAIGLATMLGTAEPRLVADHGNASLGPPVDPLNGRLRI